MRKEKKYVLLQDIVIPKGTILQTSPNNRGGKNNFETDIAMGDDSTAIFMASILAIEDMPDSLITEIK